MSILNRPRSIMIGGEVEEFANFDRLEGRAQVFIETIQQASSELQRGAVDAAREWSRIEELSGYLHDILVGQEAWLADHDAEIAAEIEKMQDLISGVATLRPT